MSNAEMWRIRWWSNSYSGNPGNFNEEFIDGDEQAELRLLRLACLQEGNGAAGGDHRRRRRFGIWTDKTPAEVSDKTETLVRGVEASRLVDGSWVAYKWTIEPPALTLAPRSTESPTA